MTFARTEPFARDEILPSWFTNKLQDRIGSLTNLSLSVTDPTTIAVVAGDDDDRIVVNVEGRWRMIDTTITRAHPGGAAGTFVVWAVAADQDINSSPDPFTDDTDYAFELRITTGANPSGVAIFRRIGSGVWSGSAITSLEQEIDVIGGARLADDVIVESDQVTVTRQPNGGFLLELVAGGTGATEIADGAVTAAKINAALKPSGSAAAGTEALRALGATGATAAAGNDARLSDVRTPTDASVTAAKIAAALKPSGSAVAATEALRALGTSALTAAAGNDSRLSDARAAASIPAAVRLSDLHLSGADASKPSASSGLNGIRYSATDTGIEYECRSAAWVAMGMIPRQTRVGRSTNFTISDDTFTEILWTSEDRDDDGMHESVTNPGRFTAIYDGLYLFEINPFSPSGLAANSSNFFYLRAVLRNSLGTQLEQWDDQVYAAPTATAGYQLLPRLHFLVPMGASQYVTTHFQGRLGSSFVLNNLSTARVARVGP